MRKPNILTLYADMKGHLTVLDSIIPGIFLRNMVLYGKINYGTKVNSERDKHYFFRMDTIFIKKCK